MEEAIELIGVHANDIINNENVPEEQALAVIATLDALIEQWRSFEFEGGDELSLDEMLKDIRQTTTLLLTVAAITSNNRGEL